MKPEFSEEELLSSITKNREGESCRYAFLLGAGASVSSNIPAAGAMAEIWLNEIREQNQAKYNAIKKLDEFDENNLAAFYPQIYQMKFGSVPQDGYQAIETYMSAEEVKPSIGYSILAQVLRHTRHNVVLTTNFDRLTETALLDFENTHARVIAHESMLNVVPVHDKKPSIIKVHRDMIFSPISTEAEIAELDKKWRPVIQTLFSRYHVIALGYGGNDGGLMSIIKEVLEANPQARLFWCYRKQLPEALPPLMSENEISGRIEPVSIAGFDEFLFKLRRRLNFGLFTDTFETSAKRRKEAYLEQLESVQKDDKSHKGSEHEKAVSDLFADTWWEVEVAVNKTDDIEEKDKLYQAGIKKFPDSRELIGNYALFLHRTRKDYDGAGLYYKKALDAEPNDADFNGNYALFLHEIRKDYDQAETFYKKALAIEPDDADFNGNYALFLHEIRKDYDQAEIYYKKALESEPDHANNNGNYALFLKNIRKDYDQAETFYKKALTIEPDDADFNGNHATFLHEIRKDYDQAEIYYKKALESEPDHANNNGNYALFLKNIRKDYNQAETYYKKALAIEPDSANKNSNYAQMLLEQGRINEAVEYLERAEALAKDNDKNLILELAFYRLALFSDWQEKSREKIHQLLAEGSSSRGWDFSGIIEQAKKEGCGYIGELNELANKISAVD